MVMKKITMMLLILFLTSCKVGIKPQVLCDASFQFDRCRCRCFDFDELKAVWPQVCKVDEIEKAWDLPLEECDGLMGFQSNVVAKKILPKLKYLKKKNRKK